MGSAPLTYLGEFEQLILLAMVRLEPGSGTPAIRDVVETGTGRKIWLGAVFTTLDRLERKALVSSRVVRSDLDGRKRKTYTLTAAGSAAVSQAYQTWTRMTRGLKPKLESLG